MSRLIISTKDGSIQKFMFEKEEAEKKYLEIREAINKGETTYSITDDKDFEYFFNLRNVCYVYLER